MKLQETALYAEIISSIAVLLTLIFLAVELRDNTDVSRSLAYGRITAEMNDFRLATNSSELLAPVWERFIYEDFEDLDRGEFIRMRALVLSIYSIFEDAYYSEKYGIMATSEWERFGAGICSNHIRMKNGELDETVENSLTAEFVDYVHTECGL